MQQKKIPVRMCAGCGEHFPKKELVTSGLCVTLLMAAEVLVKYKRRRRSA